MTTATVDHDTMDRLRQGHHLPLVEPHPATLPDTRPVSTVADLLAAVLVPCDRCGDLRHPDDLTRVIDCRDHGTDEHRCDGCL